MVASVVLALSALVFLTMALSYEGGRRVGMLVAAACFLTAAVGNAYHARRNR